MGTGTFTPGPWRKPHAKEDYAGACVVRDDGYIVADCNVFGGDNSTSAQECEANARLIAAAPDLYAACEHAAKSYHHPACSTQHSLQCDCHVGKATAALTKARGGSGK